MSLVATFFSLIAAFFGAKLNAKQLVKKHKLFILKVIVMQLQKLIIFVSQSSFELSKNSS